MKSPTLIIGVAGLIGACVWFGTGRWLSLSPDVEARQKAQAAGVLIPLPPPPPMPPSLVALNQSRFAQQLEIVPIEVQGGMLTESGQWLYVTKKGRIMTDEQLALESGGVVNARMDRGSRILYGSGVIWGGESHVEEHALPSVQSLTRSEPVHVDPVQAMHEELSKEQISTGLPLESPEGILATPKIN